MGSDIGPNRDILTEEGDGICRSGWIADVAARYVVTHGKLTKEVLEERIQPSWIVLRDFLEWKTGEEDG